MSAVPDPDHSRRSRLRLGLALTCLLVLLGAALVVPIPPPAADVGPVIRLIFAGDIMLEGTPGDWIAHGRDPFAEFAGLLAEADLTVGNLECVVATCGEKIDKKYTFRAHPRVLPVLGRHFGAVTLANNHTGDYGPDAFREQLDLLRRHRLPYFGGGRDRTEAHAPLIVERNGLRLALLGYNEYPPREFEAGSDRPGVAWSVDEQVAADIRAARSVHRADLVVPFVHWGWEEYPEDQRQKQLARLMIDAGADAVVGAHPHIVQGVEYYRGRLIAYSLGNFVFEGFKSEETQTGWLLRMTLGRSGLVEWDTVVVRLDPQGIPHLSRDLPSPFADRRSTEIRRRHGSQDWHRPRIQPGAVPRQ